MSKGIPQLFWFCIAALFDWLKNLIFYRFLNELGGDVKPLALSPSYFLNNWKGT